MSPSGLIRIVIDQSRDVLEEIWHARFVLAVGRCFDLTNPSASSGSPSGLSGLNSTTASVQPAVQSLRKVVGASSVGSSQRSHWKEVVFQGPWKYAV